MNYIGKKLFLTSSKKERQLEKSIDGQKDLMKKLFTSDRLSALSRLDNPRRSSKQMNEREKC